MVLEWVAFGQDASCTEVAMVDGAGVDGVWMAFGQDASCTEVGMVDGAGVGGVQSRRKLH